MSLLWVQARDVTAANNLGNIRDDDERFDRLPYLHDRFRHVQTPKGNYRLHDHGSSLVTVHKGPDKSGNYKMVGGLSWFGGKPRYDGSNVDGGVIYKVHVNKSHRRRGLASHMLNFARERYPEKDIRHSNAVSREGWNWANATPTPNDLKRSDTEPEHSGDDE